MARPSSSKKYSVTPADTVEQLFASDLVYKDGRPSQRILHYTTPIGIIVVHIQEDLTEFIYVYDGKHIKQERPTAIAETSLKKIINNIVLKPLG